MTAIAANQTISPHHQSPRGSDMPTCTVCADTMVAAEASAFVSDNVISYLWTCDTCGYGFVTKHRMQRIVCN
jgi:C4-type Zn-finger protein